MDIITKYFPDLSDEKANKFAQLGALYAEWNNKINVISRKDFNHFYERHVLHSLAIAKFIHFEPGTTVLDVGTGGGFPGIPLAIFFPECRFHLIDSIGKKIKVVQAVAEALKLDNVTAGQVRVESHKPTYDFVVSRAVTAFPAFVKLCKSKIKKEQHNAISNGILYLKGGEFEEEIESFKRQISVVPLTNYFEEEFFETKKIIHLSY